MSDLPETAQIEEDREAKLVLARKLVEELEAGNDVMAHSTILELAENDNACEGPLFQQVGRLTRDLHEAINGFVHDDAMAELVEVDMPDAKERLQYVIETTEQAAHTTLAAIEEALQVSEKLKARSVDLEEKWARFLSREMTVDEFRTVSSELKVFLESSAKDSKALHDKMNEIMMAQGFQDITGQVIKKVISLVKDVETRLVEFIRLAGEHHTSKNDDAIRKKKIAEEDGPVVPGVTQSDVVSGQDDVDDLLSSLGF